MAPRAKAAATKTAEPKKAPAAGVIKKKQTAKAAPAKKAAPSKPAPSKPAPKANATKAATKATTTTTKTAAAATTASKKRKVASDEEPDAPATTKRAASEVDEAPKAKKAKTTKEPAAAAAPKPPKKPEAPASVRPRVAIGRKINDAPTQILDIYVFGEGSSGELGLGSKKFNGKKPIDVRRPRLNPNLSAKDVGVVAVSAGGMHVIALTRDNKILTWGVNDQGTLGRDTTWDGGLKDIDQADDSDSDDDEGDTGMNPLETTPTAVKDEYFAEGTKFVQVVACDSASFVLTEDGRVYGWGTFRSSDGILGFTEAVQIQRTPVLIPSLKSIKTLAAGANHVLALDHKGNVLAWGCGQQNQLGRRIIERNKLSSLAPQGVGLPRGKIAKVACGAYHSFAVDKDGHVWGWGLNNFGEVGVESNAGEDGAVILKPAKVESLDEFNVTGISGGGHHSIACSAKGELLAWGRVDGYQVGIDPDTLTRENAIFDERDKPRILIHPTVVPGKYTSIYSSRHSVLTPFNRGNQRHLRGGRFRQQLRRHQGGQGLLVGLQQQLPDRPGHHRRHRGADGHRQHGHPGQEDHQRWRWRSILAAGGHRRGRPCRKWRQRDALSKPHLSDDDEKKRRRGKDSRGMEFL